MVAEKVVVQLVLDTSRYTSGASNAARSTAKLQTSVDKTSKSVSSLSKTALKAGVALGAAFAAKAALDFAKASIAAFSNLEESVNAVNVVYGEAAEGVQALGENSVEQFGLSTRAVNDAAVSLGAFVEKIDAADPANAFENIIQRATDFASVMNITTDEALDKFRAGLSGESEPLKRFGINVSEANVKLFALESGLIASGEQMDEATKIQARFGFIMQETAKTAGDFANTSDGLAGSQKKLAAQWEEMQATIGEELEPAMIKLLAAGVNIIPLFGKIGVAIAGVVDEFAPLIDAVSFFANLFGETTDDVEESAERFSLIPSQITDQFAKFFTFAGQGLITQGGQIIDFFTGAEAAAKPFIGTLELMAARERRVGEEAELMAGLLPIAPVDEFGNAIEEVTTTLGNGSSVTARYNQVLKTAALRASQVAAASDLQAASIRAVLQAQAEAADPVLRLLGAQNRLVASQERLNELRGLTGEEKATAEDLAAAILDVAGAQVELNSATVGISGVLDESRLAFIEAGVAAGIAREEMEMLADTIGTFPTSIDFQLNVLLRNDREVARLLRGPGAGFGPRRHGGPVTADEPFIVGEGGPELFIPDQAGRIIPNKAFGEQSIVVNVNDPTTTDLAADLSAGLIAAQITQQVELLRV